MTSLQDLFRERGIDFKEAGQSAHVTPGWLGVVCPFCGGGTSNYGMGFSLTTYAVRCWKCGPHRWGAALAELTGMPLREAIELSKGVARDATVRPVVHGKLKLPEGIGPLQEAHVTYLRGRGLDPEVCERVWGIRGIGIACRYAWTLFIPVFHLGQMVSWTTRTLLKEGRRYDSAPRQDEALPAKSLLYGADFAWHKVAVHEGSLDAVNVGPGATATMGVGYTRAQLLAVARYPHRTIAFDSEPGAQERARRLCAELAPYPGRTVRVELDAPDPGSAPPREVRRFRRAFLE